jgi:hypothetical protein
MKSKKHIFWISFVLIFLAWCWKTIPINFDEFSLDLKIDTETYKSMSNNSISTNIIKSYTDTNTTGFSNSLLVSKINIPWIKLDDFTKENIKSTQKAFWYNFQKSKNTTFICSWIKINGNLENFYIKLTEKNQIIYFWQYFFVTNSWWYIVSFWSDQENLRNNFSNSLSSLKCK